MIKNSAGNYLLPQDCDCCVDGCTTPPDNVSVQTFAGNGAKIRFVLPLCRGHADLWKMMQVAAGL